MFEKTNFIKILLLIDDNDRSEDIWRHVMAFDGIHSDADHRLSQHLLTTSNHTIRNKKSMFKKEIITD